MHSHAECLVLVGNQTSCAEEASHPLFTHFQEFTSFFQFDAKHQQSAQL